MTLVLKLALFREFLSFVLYYFRVTIARHPSRTLYDKALVIVPVPP